MQDITTPGMNFPKRFCSKFDFFEGTRNKNGAFGNVLVEMFPKRIAPRLHPPSCRVNKLGKLPVGGCYLLLLYGSILRIIATVGPKAAASSHIGFLLTLSRFYFLLLFLFCFAWSWFCFGFLG